MTDIWTFLDNSEIDKNIEIFVETGCYTGDAINYILNNKNYKMHYSCDINPKYVTMCKNRFPELDSKLSISTMDSVDYFNSLIPHIEDKTLFWLDAHFPAMYGMGIGTYFPVVEECNIIKNQKINMEKDFILCDDIRVFKNAEKYLTSDIMAGSFPRFEMDIDEFILIFKKTHIIEILNVGQGGVLFIPYNK